MKNTKKGFTLVELLVVIAILAILATVSVVGYTSFIDRANQSNSDTEANQIKTMIESGLMGADEYVRLTDTIYVHKITVSESSVKKYEVVVDESKAAADAALDGKKVFDARTDVKELLSTGSGKTLTATEDDGLVYTYSSEIKTKISTIGNLAVEVKKNTTAPSTSESGT